MIYNTNKIKLEEFKNEKNIKNLIRLTCLSNSTKPSKHNGAAWKNQKIWKSKHIKIIKVQTFESNNNLGLYFYQSSKLTEWNATPLGVEWNMLYLKKYDISYLTLQPKIWWKIISLKHRFKV